MATKAAKSLEIIAKIINVRLEEFDADRLWGRHIDLPNKGDEICTYGLEIIGWVVGKSSPAVAVEAIANGRVVQTVSVELPRPGVGKKYSQVRGATQSGFNLPVAAIALPDEGELLLQAVLKDGSRVAIAVIEFKRLQKLHSSYEAKLQPLIIVSAGPSGGDKLWQMLGAHPSILAKGENLSKKLAIEHLLKPLISLTKEAYPFNNKMVEKKPLWRWWGKTYLENLAGFCQESIDDFYRQIAGKKIGKLTYFVENYPINALEVLNVLGEIYPQRKEIILVRDFREVVYSMLPFNKAYKGGFDENKFESYQQFVYEFSKNEVGQLLARWKERCCIRNASRTPQTYLVRYEDLIHSPAETLKGILEYLELDNSPATVSSLLAGSSGSKKQEPELGYWQYEMPASLQVLCSEVCSEALQEFGYE